MNSGEIPLRRIRGRKVFLQLLAQAGWDVEGWEGLREAGASVDLDAEAEYAGPVLALRLELRGEPPYLTFQVAQRDGELVLCLRLYPSGDLAPVLAKIVAAQDTLDADNHPRLIKALIPLCDPLLIETDQGVFSLS